MYVLINQTSTISDTGTIIYCIIRVVGRDDEPQALAPRRKLGHEKMRTRHGGGFAFGSP